MNEEQAALPVNITDPERRSFLARTSMWSVGALALPLAGCGHNMVQDDGQDGQDAAYTIDTSVQSPNQDSRIRTLVLHYTAETLENSIALLTDPQRQGSAHYLVPETADEADGSGRFRIYALVPESCRAWHAGVSYWQGERMLNASTIGIEVVNLGFPAQDQNAPLMKRRWYPYSDAQIAVVARLAADVIARHNIRPQKVVGHSDIAPGRKSDPGPLFPWRKLYAEYGIGAWPEAEAVSYYSSREPFRGDIGALQGKLLAYGYDTPQTGVLDAQTGNVIAAFQMHFRAAKYDGAPDIETVAILDALLEKYFRRGRMS